MLSISQARWLAVGIVLGVSVLTSPWATAQQPAVSKEDLRYDGKTFGYWQTYWRTELKPELRVEAIRALAAFGTNGYAEEAAVIVLEVMEAYDLVEAFYKYNNYDTNLLGPDHRVVVEALQALKKIGAPVVPRLLVSNLADPKIGAVAMELLGHWNRLKVAPSDVPALVAGSQAKDLKVAAAAVRILYCQTDEKSIEDALQSALATDGVARKLGAALVRVWKEAEDKEFYAARTLLTNLASTNHAGVELMVEFVKDLAPARQQALEDRAESRRKKYDLPAYWGGMVVPDDRARFVVPEEATIAVSWGEDRYKLSSDPGAARTTTIELLGLLADKGRAARDVLPLLRDPNLAQDPCRTVRQAVADAIAKIDRPRRAP
jgi:hypothetical protein